MRLDATTTRSRRQPRGSGFTLVELLIVLVIIALLAALVLPGFSSATTSARQTNLTDNLRHVRTQLLMYAAQHDGVAPGYPDGDTTATPDAAAFVAQMTGYTNKLGQTPDTPDEAFALGPYLRNIPANSINLSAAVRMIGDGEPFPTGPTSGGGAEGWFYQPSTLTFVANAPGEDTTGRAYFDY